MASLTAGCAESHRVAYSVDDVVARDDSPIAHVRLMVSPLRDIRQRTKGNEVLFRESNEAEIDDKSYCINAEEGYRWDSVGTQISEALALHLRKRRTLRAVSVGARVQGAYYLKGTLRRFYAAQLATPNCIGPAIVAGLVGVAVAAMTAADWTPGFVSIEIVDLTINDGSGNPIARLPDINYTDNAALPASSSCEVVYANLDEKLKKVLTGSVVLIENAISEAEYRSRRAQSVNAH